uniref:Armadillo repeat containing 1, like n=1 Tax=Latimeria chalumnae TaxID=7897 RepID=H3AHQ2_LATCH
NISRCNAEEIKCLAKEIYEILNTPVCTKAEETSEPHKRRIKAQFFLNSSNKKAKTVTFQIQGMDNVLRMMGTNCQRCKTARGDTRREISCYLHGVLFCYDHLATTPKKEQRGLCEEALLKVKGVISFTFHMALKRCTVRISSDLQTESLAKAIAATKVLKAQQVVKNEFGEELLVVLKQESVSNVEKNLNLPDYLPEDESPEKDMEKAVSQNGVKQDTTKNWLNTAANFLTKTFYW